MPEFIQSYTEGHDGSLIGILRYAFALVPHPIEVESDPFQRKYLESFKGGEPSAEGMSKIKVVTDFFSTAKRNLLVITILILYCF